MSASEWEDREGGVPGGDIGDDADVPDDPLTGGAEDLEGGLEGAEDPAAVATVGTGGYGAGTETGATPVGPGAMGAGSHEAGLAGGTGDLGGGGDLGGDRGPLEREGAEG